MIKLATFLSVAAVQSVPMSNGFSRQVLKQDVACDADKADCCKSCCDAAQPFDGPLRSAVWANIARPPCNPDPPSRSNSSPLPLTPRSDSPRTPVDQIHMQVRVRAGRPLLQVALRPLQQDREQPDGQAVLLL